MKTLLRRRMGRSRVEAAVAEVAGPVVIGAVVRGAAVVGAAVAGAAVAVAVVVGAVGLTVVGGGATASASETGTTADAELEPGECVPSIAQPGQPVVCTWARPANARAAHVEIADDPSPVRLPCRVTELAIECRYLQAAGTASTLRVDLLIDGERRRSAAVFAVDHQPQNPAVRIPGGSQPVRFAGDAFAIELEVTADLETDIWLVASREGGTTTALRALRAGSTLGTTVADLSLLDPGQYQLEVCAGASSTECTPQPGHWLLQVIPERLESLDGPATPDADRINMVIATSGLDIAPDERLSLVRSMLGLDGPIGVRRDGTPGTNGDVVDLEYGPFAIAPLDSQTHKFNLWLIAADIFDSNATIPTPTGWNDTSTTMLFADLDSNGLSSAGRAGTADGPGRPTLADARVAVDPAAPIRASDTIAHEWGHSLFGLADEYPATDPDPTQGLNCVHDQATARAAWAAHIGEEDPFSRRYLAQLREAGLEPHEDVVELTRGRPSQGGCRSTEQADVWRPTVDSLMNSQIPILGPVNRAEVERILDLWSGARPYLGFDDVAATCRAGDTTVSCTLELGQGVAAPSSSFQLIAPAAAVSCETVAGSDPIVIQCPPVAAERVGDVELALASERVALVDDEPTSTDRARTTITLIALAGLVAIGGLVLIASTITKGRRGSRT